MGTKDTPHGPTPRSCHNNPGDAAAPVLLPGHSSSFQPPQLLIQALLHRCSSPATSHVLCHFLCQCLKNLSQDGLRVVPLAGSGIPVPPGLPWHYSPLAAPPFEPAKQGTGIQIIHWALSSSEITGVWKEAEAALIFWVFQRCSTISHASDVFDVFFCIIL